MLKISWLSSAVNDLADILAYISERNPVAARDLRQRIESVILPLAEHPYLYRTGRVHGTRELVAHPNYVVVYRVTDLAIEIVSVLHARREYP